MTKNKAIRKRGKLYQLTLKSDGDLYIMHITDGTYNTYQQLRSWQSFKLKSFLNGCIDDFERLKHNMPKTEAMKTKEITVIPPEGYEIDEQNSTLQRIVFKEKVKTRPLPKTWEELELVKGAYVNDTSKVHTYPNMHVCDSNRNTWPTKEEAEASIALAQLCQLRDRYNDGWKPSDMDWYEKKSTISIVEGAPFADISTVTSRVLTFKTSELRNEFLQNFRDLIEIARPLL